MDSILPHTMVLYCDQDSNMDLRMLLHKCMSKIVQSGELGDASLRCDFFSHPRLRIHGYWINNEFLLLYQISTLVRAWETISNASQCGEVTCQDLFIALYTTQGEGRGRKREGGEINRKKEGERERKAERN